MSKPRVLLADDHQMFIAGLRKLLESDFEVVGAVSEGASLIRDAQRLKPALVVADVSMPGLSGIEAARLLRERLPDVRFVLLTMHADADFAEQALSAGADAYVLKRDAPEILIRAMHDALRGNRYFPPELLAGSTMQAGSRSPKRVVTPRQRQILQMISQGYAQKQIAAELHISPKTVEFHKYKLMRDLRAHSTAQLVAMAVKKGWTVL